MGRVFISYQTRTHREQLPLITESLRESGLDYWLDADHEIGMLRVQGRELHLVWALQAADVILVLDPEPGRQLTFSQKVLDTADFIVSALSVEGYGPHTPLFVPYYYYMRYCKFFYDVDLRYDPFVRRPLDVSANDN